MVSIHDILNLDPKNPNVFVGQTIPSKFSRTFGGQVAGQALVAAVKTVETGPRVHSLHGYFLRPGDPHSAITYEVERVRNGRSFCTRRVSASQNNAVIFTMSASFHTGDVGISHQDRQPAVAPAESLPDAKTLPEYRNSLYEEWKDWDIRIVPEADPTEQATAVQRVWFKYRDALPADHALHVCALTYMSDMMLLRSAMVRHPGVPVQAASLDHALWFLRPFRADQWLLYDQSSPSAESGRALAQGRIFNEDGLMVASVVQEGLTRIHRDPYAAAASGPHELLG